MMLLFVLFTFILFSQSIAIDSYCQKNSLCHLNNQSMIIICDNLFDKYNETNILCFPSVNKYSFRNFQQIQSNIFQNLTFHPNQSIIIQLLNISLIDSETFSKSLNLPHNSNLSIDIEYFNSSSSIILQSNAFNQIKIDRLRFFNLNNFNGRPVFNTNCFGNNLEINELIFEQCGLTGFSNNIQKVANVNRLAIINSPALTQLTDKNLPSFLSTTKSFEISNTGLQIINSYTFQAWSLILEELIISNNSNLEIFPSHITEGVFMKLNKLDLSYNSIKILDKDYDWHAYSYAKELLLRNQQLDLFLKTNILSQLPLLERIDFSEGFINEDLIQNYFSNLTNLMSIDVSYTNLTENMIINLLTHISQTTNRFVDIHLHGHVLSDNQFCSYFTIFKNAPNLLNLQLDESHECNCVIDLFFADKLPLSTTNNSDLLPSCLFNSTRAHCDILTQLSTSNCPQNSGSSNTDDHIGSYAFGGLVAGLGVLVLVLLSLGFTAIYRIRRRRNTDLTMEQPIENPLDAIIEERLQKP